MGWGGVGWDGCLLSIISLTVINKKICHQYRIDNLWPINKM